MNTIEHLFVRQVERVFGVDQATDLIDDVVFEHGTRRGAGEFVTHRAQRGEEFAVTDLDQARYDDHPWFECRVCARRSSASLERPYPRCVRHQHQRSAHHNGGGWSGS